MIITKKTLNRKVKNLVVIFITIVSLFFIVFGIKTCQRVNDYSIDINSLYGYLFINREHDSFITFYNNDSGTLFENDTYINFDYFIEDNNIIICHYETFDENTVESDDYEIKLIAVSYEKIYYISKNYYFTKLGGVSNE